MMSKHADRDNGYHDNEDIHRHEATTKPGKRRKPETSFRRAGACVGDNPPRQRSGFGLDRPDDLFRKLTRIVLDEEMTKHLCCVKHKKTSGQAANTRNVTTVKTVATDAVGSR